MSRKHLRTFDYLGHIFDAIHQIRQYTDGMTEDVFLESRLVQDAVLRNIEIIGEAAQNIRRYDPSFIAKYTDVPWDEVYWIRNRVIHGYFSMDLKIIWAVVQCDLPALEQQLLELQATLK